MERTTQCIGPGCSQRKELPGRGRRRRDAAPRPDHFRHRLHHPLKVVQIDPLVGEPILREVARARAEADARHAVLARAAAALGGTGEHDINEAMRAQNLQWASGGARHELAVAASLPNAVLVLVPPGRADAVRGALDDACAGENGAAVVVDIDAETRVLTVAGPAWATKLQAFDTGEADVALVQFEGAPVIAITGVGIVDGATLLADQACAGELFGALVRAGCVPAGTAAWRAAHERK